MYVSYMYIHAHVTHSEVYIYSTVAATCLVADYTVRVFGNVLVPLCEGVYVYTAMGTV